MPGDPADAAYPTGEPPFGAIRARALSVLESHWDGVRGWSVPNPTTYPHLWLWDSCFHSVVWAHLGDARALTELTSALAGQLADGLVPHMRYGGGPPDTFLGPLRATSSLAQPPMFGHALRVLHERGVDVPAGVRDRARRGLLWLLEHRRDSATGLLFVVHPWEAGNDHSPRWDDWGAPGGDARTYDRAARTAWNKALVGDLTYASDGAALWSDRFVVCPAAFNAYVALNLRELAAVTGEGDLHTAASEIADAMDVHLWSPREGLWSDLAVVGGGPSVEVPTSDGVMGALVTSDPAKAAAAMDQLGDPRRFGSAHGPANVARTHPDYHPGGYWRGAAWPCLSYLLWMAERRWEREEHAAVLARTSRRDALLSDWAEYWNAETGEALGASPQSWTGLVLAMGDEASTASTTEARSA